MCSGTVIMPNQLSQQISDKSSGVDQMQEGIDDMNKAIYNFGVDERLSGGGYDAARKRLSSYRAYIDGVGYRMKRMVGADGTVSDELSVFGGAEPVSRDEWQSLYDQAGRMKEAYQASAKAHAEAASHAASGGGSDADSGGMVQREEVAAATADRLAGQAEERQAVAKEWLDKIDSYLSATDGVYDQIGEMTDSLGQAAAAFSAAGYDAASMDWGEADMSWVPGLQHACRSVPTGQGIVTEDADGNPVCNEDELEDIYDKPASLLGEDDYRAWRDAMEHVAQKCVDYGDHYGSSEENRQKYDEYAEIFNKMMQMGYKEGETKTTNVTSETAPYDPQHMIQTQYKMKQNFKTLLQTYQVDVTEATYSGNRLDSLASEDTEDRNIKLRAIYALGGIVTGLLAKGQQYTVTTVVNVDSSGNIKGTDTNYKDYTVPNNLSITWEKTINVLDGSQKTVTKYYIDVNFGTATSEDYGTPLTTDCFSVANSKDPGNATDAMTIAQAVSAARAKRDPVKEGLDAAGQSAVDSTLGEIADQMAAAVNDAAALARIFTGLQVIGTVVDASASGVQAYGYACTTNAALDSMVTDAVTTDYLSDQHIAYAGAVIYGDGSVGIYMPGFANDADRQRYQRMMSAYETYAQENPGTSFGDWEMEDKDGNGKTNKQEYDEQAD